MNSLHLQSKSPEVRRKANALPCRQHVRTFWGYESWESLESKHVVGERLYSVAVYSTESCKVTLEWQCPFSQRWNLYSFRCLHQSAYRTVVCFQRSIDVCWGRWWRTSNQQLNSPFLFSVKFGGTRQRLKQHTGIWKSSYGRNPDCSLSTYAVSVPFRSSGGAKHGPYVTASSLLDFKATNPRSRAEWSVCQELCGGCHLLNQGQQVLTPGSSHPLVVHLLAKHLLWEWSFLLCHPGKRCFQHHRKAPFILKETYLHYYSGRCGEMTGNSKAGGTSTIYIP